MAMAKEHSESSEHAGQEVRPSRTALLDWIALCSCLLLLVSSALLLANGTCSSPNGLSAASPVCIGGQLSVQVWLAIVGVEFTVACTVLLPRLLSTAISKSLTAKLMGDGAPLAKTLNSMSNAPFWTQIRKGRKRFVVGRFGTALLAVAVTILYKFSFVLVDRQDTLPVTAGWVEVSNSPWVPGLYCRVTDSWTGDGSIFNNNYRDLVSGANNSILYQGSWAANATSGPAKLFVGPSINSTSVPQLRSGMVSRCVPAAYTTFTISTDTAPSSWADASAPFNSSIDLSEPQVTYPSGQYIRITGKPDGGLAILPLNNESFFEDASSDPKFGVDYQFVTSIDIEDCWGNFSWNNALGYQVFQMQEPTDTFCTKRDMSSLNATFRQYSEPDFIYMQSIINAYFAGRPVFDDPEFTFYWDPTRAIELFLLALPMVTAPPLPEPGSLTLADPARKALCDAHYSQYNDGPCWAAPSFLAVVSGTIGGHGTGMTALGLALQGFVLLLALIGLVVLLGPGLAVLTEWPAQWLGLTADMPSDDIADSARGASLGRGFAEGQDMVFLASAAAGDAARLRLVSTPRMGI